VKCGEAAGRPALERIELHCRNGQSSKRYTRSAFGGVEALRFPQ